MKERGVEVWTGRFGSVEEQSLALHEVMDSILSISAEDKKE